MRTTDKLAGYRPAHSLFRQIEVKRALPSYGRYARFRNLMRKEPPPADTSTPVALFRDRRAVYALEGGRCRQCGATQFPRQQVCIECSDRTGLEAVRLSRRGTVLRIPTTTSPKPLRRPWLTPLSISTAAGGCMYKSPTAM
jgi:hypothetical protein